MPGTRASAARVLHLGFLAYLLVALVYTTNYFILSPVCSLVLCLSGSDRSWIKSTNAYNGAPRPRIDLIAKAREASSSTQDPDDGTKTTSFWDFASSDDVLYWADSSKQGDDLDFSDSVPIRETTFLSKAFSQSMHPTKIIPYYY